MENAEFSWALLSLDGLGNGAAPRGAMAEPRGAMADPRGAMADPRCPKRCGGGLLPPKPIVLFCFLSRLADLIKHQKLNGIIHHLAM